MSIDRQFEKHGVELKEDNSLPQGQRTQKNVKRVIAAVRAAESEFNDELRTANQRCRDAQELVIDLQHKLYVAETELKRFRLNEKLESVPALTVADRTGLLEMA